MVLVAKLFEHFFLLLSIFDQNLKVEFKIDLHTTIQNKVLYDSIILLLLVFEILFFVLSPFKGAYIYSLSLRPILENPAFFFICTHFYFLFGFYGKGQPNN